MPYTFKAHNQPEPTTSDSLEGISVAYVRYCEAHKEVRHASVPLRRDGVEVGFINSGGNVYGKVSATPVLYIPGTPEKVTLFGGDLSPAELKLIRSLCAMHAEVLDPSDPSVDLADAIADRIKG